MRLDFAVVSMRYHLSITFINQALVRGDTGARGYLGANTMRWLALALLGAGVLSAADKAFDAAEYSGPATKLIGAALADEHSLDRLEYLCDRIGNRLSGSPALEKAIAWAEAEMKAADLENVRVLPVKVPHWVRGQESLTMIEPVSRPVFMLGLGDSVGTPADGIEAEVVTVSDFGQLASLGRDKVAGKIVLYNAPFESYGATVMYRTAGPSEAAKLGAVAALVRSVTPVSLRDPHTGTLNYEDGVPKIPAAALSVEDAEALARLAKAGVPVRVRLKMGAHMEPEADSADVMGEIRGSEKPDEVVVLGGHVDSWDVGQGAQDDGTGIMASFEAVALMKRLGLRPKRTVRVVFWVNEENGGAGGRAYRDWLGDKVKNHVAAIEMDGGAEKPLGFGFGGGEGMLRRRRAPGVAAPLMVPKRRSIEESDAEFARVVEIGKLLDIIGAGNITHGGGGSDIAPLIGAGVPGFGLRTVGTHYFDWHHSNADTFDKVDPTDFRQCVATLAVMSYVLADMPERLSSMK
ncbi:MAG TPA: M20/M25/M40 family metallo-hydrolase [Bryobacteraceae bacterium]|nr:M20/M25/M40 family metallo-hydrolase [Bryobacteraceae bacterium]